jgi:hypothetical protein
MAHLIPPTTRVRNSYLAGETEAAIEEGLSTDWLQEAAVLLIGSLSSKATIALVRSAAAVGLRIEALTWRDRPAEPSQGHRWGAMGGG